MSETRAGYGWQSDFPEFRSTSYLLICDRLHSFVRDASPEQIRAWGDSIPPLQREVEEVLVRDVLARGYSAILEYELPLESRRPDVLLLVGDGVLVVELKGKLEPSQAAIDQAAAYARDLRCYHRECWNRPVVAVLVPTRAKGYVRQVAGVHIAGPDALDSLVTQFTGPQAGASIDRERFLDESAYCPLPTLVESARELFNSGELRTIHRARAATDPAVETITAVVHEAARTKTRHLVLLTGVPGAGKTLVGLRTVHAHYLDDLAVPRQNGKATVPAVFLSGNGPLVEVLQYELRGAGGGGKTFVRGVKGYVKPKGSRWPSGGGGTDRRFAPLMGRRHRSANSWVSIGWLSCAIHPMAQPVSNPGCTVAADFLQRFLSRRPCGDGHDRRIVFEESCIIVADGRLDSSSIPRDVRPPIGTLLPVARPTHLPRPGLAPRTTQTGIASSDMSRVY
jgi:hypothetical protein